ncbi:hypothetical protein [Nonomuraea sp. KM90]|uniref:hypothetical protein n=1 Tax=Nonomuraea sp. KM90 TaxID=3457428 RepID=UPI003FCD21B5
MGGTQERSAGLAELWVLRGMKPVTMATRGNRSRFRRHLMFKRRAWARYAPAVGELFYKQLLYVLCHGSRRWQAHEIANVIGMVNWLLDDDELAFQNTSKQGNLKAAMNRYIQDWTALNAQPSVHHEELSKADRISVQRMISMISHDWTSALNSSHKLQQPY